MLVRQQLVKLVQLLLVHHGVGGGVVLVVQAAARRRRRRVPRGGAPVAADRRQLAMELATELFLVFLKICL